MKKKGILIVSYGTVLRDAKERSLDRIGEDIRNAFPEIPVYEAWSGERLIDKVKSDGLSVCTVEEAIMRIRKDGITKLIVQPTHMIDGEENRKMWMAVEKYYMFFDEVLIGKPLLPWDADEVIRAVMKEYVTLPEDIVLLFAGHGSNTCAETVYELVDQRMKSLGHRNVFLRTMRDEEHLEELMKQWKERGIKKVILTPFMLAAGRHMEIEIAGGRENSWRRRLEMAGFRVECHMKGLGEYKKVREIFVMRINDIIIRQSAKDVI